MNRVITMAEMARLVGMAGKSTRLITRKLRAVAESRGSDFAMFKLGKTWCTTEADLRRLIPELFAHDAADETALRGMVARQAEELRELRGKVDRLTNMAWARPRTEKRA